ncbi:NADH-quinone oxidoreductase subunit L [Campylobacter sp. 19-13652]|uniref:NADH-quinone oxidoreductase subunit L n=1 Tax=Campylobacter sp. 19-13652 TaxID=2840180 RepID=UPI001C79A53F|nr:NADH-quinone oxidoreductase subunit L [Campylobacter sp. 19-13652]BCX78746.1 NADH-quinone oxidoreductase subunit L [Campylobacter sp. 19-13652]
MNTLFFTALFAPLVSAIISGAFGANRRYLALGVVSSVLVAISAVASLLLLAHVYSGFEESVGLFKFISVGSVDINYGFIIDSLSVTMMCVVGVVASVVHIYSIGYMSHDAGFNRFFSYLGLFVFSMLVLVSSDNLLGLFIGWEGVGVCSWLLIGFWYEKKSASWAANEAFLANRVADLAMLLGIFLAFTQTGSLRYEEIFASLSSIDAPTLTLIAALLFIGAMGKSAQFPFHTWLADAMEGPTPVSALIHAATMVTAGVYLVLRAHPIFELAPEVSTFIACLGAFVAIFAASMAVVEKDLKRIIAYSTLSQLGYMFVAAGLGAYWVALFHLVTHAFFKSLLFLGAGNVMHAMHDELNIHKMGGLFKFMRPTAILMAIGSVALCGIYPFAGFFSKDKILEVAFASGHSFIWAVLLAGAVLTAFYSFRLIMLVFFGKSKFSFTPHEAPNFMLVALIPLAGLAIFAGFFEHSFEHFIMLSLPKLSIDLAHDEAIKLVLITSGLVIASILFAIFAYKKEIFPPKLANTGIYKLLANAYYIPQIYNFVFVGGFKALGVVTKIVDEFFIDGIVMAVAKGTKCLGSAINSALNNNLSLMLRLVVLALAILLGFIFIV